MTVPEQDGFDAIEYPIDFAFKAVCEKKPANSIQSIEETLQQTVAEVLGAAAVKKTAVKESKAGKYVSVTTLAHLQNRQELEAVYRAISSLEIVKMTL